MSKLLGFQVLVCFSCFRGFSRTDFGKVFVETMIGLQVSVFSPFFSVLGGFSWEKTNKN